MGDDSNKILKVRKINSKKDSTAICTEEVENRKDKKKVKKKEKKDHDKCDNNEEEDKEEEDEIGRASCRERVYLEV